MRDIQSEVNDTRKDRDPCVPLFYGLTLNMPVQIFLGQNSAVPMTISLIFPGQNSMVPPIDNPFKYFSTKNLLYYGLGGCSTIRMSV